MSAIDTGRLLTTNEAAARLGISKRTIQELTASRKLAFIKFGRNVRFDPADLAAFTEKNRVKAIGWKGGAA
jgi:excisionase family DNA binding protein